MSYLFWTTVLGSGILAAFLIDLSWLFFCYGTGFFAAASLLKRRLVRPNTHWGYSPAGQVIVGLSWYYWGGYTYYSYPDLSSPYIALFLLIFFPGIIIGYRAKKQIIKKAGE